MTLQRWSERNLEKWPRRLTSNLGSSLTLKKNRSTEVLRNDPLSNNQDLYYCNSYNKKEFYEQPKREQV